MSLGPGREILDVCRKYALFNDDAVKILTGVIRHLLVADTRMLMAPRLTAADELCAVTKDSTDPNVIAARERYLDACRNDGVGSTT